MLRLFYSPLVLLRRLPVVARRKRIRGAGAQPRGERPVRELRRAEATRVLLAGTLGRAAEAAVVASREREVKRGSAPCPLTLAYAKRRSRSSTSMPRPGNVSRRSMADAVAMKTALTPRKSAKRHAMIRLLRIVERPANATLVSLCRAAVGVVEAVRLSVFRTLLALARAIRPRQAVLTELVRAAAVDVPGRWQMPGL